MDSQLAILFYVGIIAPTLITIAIFVGFLICLYKRNKHKNVTLLKPTQRHPLTPRITASYRNKKSNNEKFENSSQQSADSAIDMNELDTASVKGKSLDMEQHGRGILIDAQQLHSGNYAYQNEAAQITVETDFDVRKGRYPSQGKLNEELSSPIRIYEKASDAQLIALQLQTENDYMDSTCAQTMSKVKRNLTEGSNPRYTSTTKLAPDVSSSELVNASSDLKRANSLSLKTSNELNRTNYALVSYWQDQQNYDSKLKSELYASNYNSSRSWKPNITTSGSSTTDNYSTVETSQV